MKLLTSGSWEAKLNLLSFFFLCLFFFDCSWAGAGRWLMFGPVSIRMVLLGTAMLLSIPSLLRNAKMVLSNVFTLCLFAFLVLIVVNAVRGVNNGNNMTILINDLKGYSYYFMFPTLLVTICSERRITTLMKAVVAGSLFQAVYFMVIFADCALFDFRFYIDFEKLHELQIFMISPYGNHVIGIYAYSSIYMIAGCVCAAVLFLNEHDTTKKWFYPIATGLVICSIFSCYSRSIYLGTFVAAVAALVFIPGMIRYFLDVLKFVLCALLVFAIILSFMSVKSGVNYFSTAVERALSPLLSASNDEELQGENDSEFKEDTTRDINEEQGQQRVEVVEPTAEQSEDDNVTPEETIKPDQQQQVGGTESTAAPKDESGLKIEETTEANQQQLNGAEFLMENTRKSDYLREDTVAALLDKIKQHPIVGQGLGAEVEFREKGLTEYFYLNLIHETGFIGLAIYLLPLLFLLKIGYMRRKVSGEPKLARMQSAILCSLLGIMTTSFFNPYMGGTLGIAIFSLAMAVSSFQKEKQTIQDALQEEKGE